MYSSGPAPTDQRPGVRPISFILSVGGQLRPPVTLPIRPEDLNRVESSRATVHQTLGRGPIGWVDNFGEALPSCTISGHTGWRYAQGIGRDGWGSFEDLNQLVQRDYHEEKQAAIDAGRDPAEVQLLFVDALDDFAWSVVPTQFVLRRSKSRPLLFQYQISLQAVSTEVEWPSVDIPVYGNNGIRSLQTATATLQANIASFVFPPYIAPATSGTMLSGLVRLSASIFQSVAAIVGGVNAAADSATLQVLNLARDLAQVGLNVFRTITAVANLSADMYARAARIAAAFNEVVCIFSNALKPKKVYEEYSPLYGASNCSSTTGGRAPSIYAGQNVFALMMPSGGAVSVSSAALASVSAIKNADPVLSPMSWPEVVRNGDAIVQGVTL